jgi:hypothetical protein
MFNKKRFIPKNDHPWFVSLITPNSDKAVYKLLINIYIKKKYIN